MAWVERYVDAAAAGGGDGTTAATSGANGAWTLAEAIAAVAAGQRVNIKAGTYTNTTTTSTLGTNGTTTAPIWWRGYNTTIGDIDTNNALTKPVLSYTTGRLAITGSFQIISNLDVNGAQTTNGQVNFATGTNMVLSRCRVECTAANAAGRAVNVNTANVTISRCWLKATSSAEVVGAPTATGCTIMGCAFVGGNNGILTAGATSLVVCFCAFNACGGDGIRSTGGTNRIWSIANTFSSQGSDAIEITVAPLLVVAYNNLFASCAYGINNSTGGNIATVLRGFNDFYNMGTGQENGMGDMPSFLNQTESVSPFDTGLALVGTSNAKGNGFPGAFENQVYTSYLDIGAVQRQEPSGGGGIRLAGHGGLAS